MHCYTDEVQATGHNWCVGLLQTAGSIVTPDQVVMLQKQLDMKSSERGVSHLAGCSVIHLAARNA